MAGDSAIVKRLTDEVFVGGNLAPIDELVADGYVDHDPAPGIPPDKEGVRLLAQTVSVGFTDRKIEFDDYADLTDGRVVENWAMTGTHTGEVFGLPPSGQNARVRGMEIFRCEAGKVVEHWGVVDMSDLVEKAMGAAQ
jgi:predicted SnoaL-like aldol condensation-catalyzing enzyme